MKTSMILAVVLAGLGAGCGSAREDMPVDLSKTVAPLDRAEEAIGAVLDLYAITSTPEIYWYGGAALDCPMV